MNGLSTQIKDFGDAWIEQLQVWLVSHTAWSQFAFLILAYFLARFASGVLDLQLRKALTPAPEDQSLLARLRQRGLMLLPLLPPVLAYLLALPGESLSLSLFGSGSVVALGKRIFLYQIARRLVDDVIRDPFLKLMGRYILLPAMALNVVGLLGPLQQWLSSLTVTLGSISFSAMALVRGAIAGALLFWFGRWSNNQSRAYIVKQEELRPATRELASKAAEIAIFGTAFLLLMSVMGINLSALAVLGGAVGVGLGFGLQKIASNFISGVILLLEGQATVGDYVELDGGEAGTIIKMMARATILETFDGRWIVVPNEDFITTRVVNYSDSGSANRYEAPFSVSYDTDINLVPDIVEKAVGKHPAVLDKPYPPDCELRGFGDSGVDFAVEFWVNGIDDGDNKYVSDVLFLVWNALKEAGIEIPYPHRVVEFKGAQPALEG